MSSNERSSDDDDDDRIQRLRMQLFLQRRDSQQYVDEIIRPQLKQFIIDSLQQQRHVHVHTLSR